jgi:hypothetical protein
MPLRSLLGGAISTSAWTGIDYNLATVIGVPACKPQTMVLNSRLFDSGLHETSTGMHPGSCILNRESVNHMKGSTHKAHFQFAAGQ